MKRLELNIKSCRECPYLRAKDVPGEWDIIFCCKKSRAIGEFNDAMVIQDNCQLNDYNKCPHCYSTNTESILISGTRWKRKCNDCGNKWV